MCIGFAVGDLVYFMAAGLLGYSAPFRELPELSVVVVAVQHDSADDRLDVLPWHAATLELPMSTPMVMLAIVLLACGWLGFVAKRDLALLEHGLMMPAMLIPMLLRLDLYTGRADQTARSDAARIARRIDLLGLTPRIRIHIATASSGARLPGPPRRARVELLLGQFIDIHHKSRGSSRSRHRVAIRPRPPRTCRGRRRRMDQALLRRSPRVYSGDPRLALKAAEAVLDGAYGKPGRGALRGLFDERGLSWSFEPELSAGAVDDAV